DDLRLDAMTLQQIGKKSRRGHFASRRIRRIDPDVALQQDDLRRDLRLFRNVELRQDLRLGAPVVNPQQADSHEGGDDGNETPATHRHDRRKIKIAIRIARVVAEIHSPMITRLFRYSMTTRCVPGATTMP